MLQLWPAELQSQAGILHPQLVTLPLHLLNGNVQTV